MKRENDLVAQVARGEYVIDTYQVAEAMIRRRGCGLLMLVPNKVERPAVRGPEGDPGPGLSAA
jgi:hypothetical protein